MISRFNYEPPKVRDSSKDDEFSKFTYEKRMKVVSSNKDGSVDKYVEESFWKEEKCSWKDLIKSYDIGSPSEQMKNHLKKGTPLITAHTLPYGDYSSLGKGAEIRKEMLEKGITVQMVVDAVKEALVSKEEEKDKGKEGVENA